MKPPIKDIPSQSPLRKNFDSFTTEHKLRDVQEEFTQAVYRFRESERTNAPNLVTLKREMEFLDRKVRVYRYSLYSGLPVEGNFIEEQAPHISKRCPVPAWEKTWSTALPRTFRT